MNNTLIESGNVFNADNFIVDTTLQNNHILQHSVFSKSPSLQSYSPSNLPMSFLNNC